MVGYYQQSVVLPYVEVSLAVLGSREKIDLIDFHQTSHSDPYIYIHMPLYRAYNLILSSSSLFSLFSIPSVVLSCPMPYIRINFIYW